MLPLPKKGKCANIIKKERKKLRLLKAPLVETNTLLETQERKRSMLDLILQLQVLVTVQASTEGLERLFSTLGGAIASLI